MTPSKWICKDLNLTDFNKLEKFIFINRLKWKTVHLRSKRTITDRHTQKKKKNQLATQSDNCDKPIMECIEKSRS